ncbi:hypothetical protein FRC17_006278, partial [Serendipita sp. 399]
MPRSVEELQNMPVSKTNTMEEKRNGRDLESGTTTVVAPPEEQPRSGSVESLPTSNKEEAEHGTATVGESVVFVDG